MTNGEFSRILDHCPEGIKIKRRHFRPGEFILRQGDEAKNIYILLEGQAKHFSVTPNGVHYLIYTSAPDDFLGELEIFNRFPIKHNIQAFTDCETIEIDGEDFIRWLHLDEEFLLFCYRKFTNKVYKSNMMSATNIAYPLKYRVESFLWSTTISGRRYIDKEDVVYSLGAKVRSINRIVQGLIEEGLIEYDSKVIKVLSLDRLADSMTKCESKTVGQK